MFQNSACNEFTAYGVLALYFVSEWMSSGACSYRCKHVLVVMTYCAICVSVEMYILIDIIVDEEDVLSESSIIQ